jgi:diaminopimelate epimerase
MALPERFVKMAGGGNDFILFEADGRRLGAEDERRLALICRRGLSVGADGVLFLSGGEADRVRLDYYNADGRLASFCANGTRCAARYAVARRLVSGNAPVLETGFGPIPAVVEDGEVTLRLPPLPLPGDPIRVEGEGLPPAGTPMHVGVPHLVLFVEGDLETLPVSALGRALRRHPLMPEGANVNFVRANGSGGIRVRTYERGVEAETLACGSGVVASAAVAARLGLVSPPVTCGTKSGVDFTVDFREEDGRLIDVTLRGDAREIFSAKLTPEAWRE